MQRRPDKLEIGVLYGFRALMVLCVVNYHLWQQSWIPQYFTLFGHHVSMDFWTRSSYVFVDGMILLSGFLLYLPYARQKQEGTPVPTAARFYFNRAARILPSYLFAVLAALLCIAIPQNLFYTPDAMRHDVAAHLTFTFVFWPQTYVSTPLNVALWTICVEMHFYLIIPLLARAMQKRPSDTAIAMIAAGWGYRFCIAAFVKDTNIFINQMPAFLDVYAIGMLGANAYLCIKRWMEKADVRQRCAVWLGTVGVFILGACALVEILRAQSAAGANGHDALRLSQMKVRFALALSLGSMMMSAAFWPPILQKLLDNRLMRFLSTISMNLYIWHQVLAVEMRKAWFPNTDLLHTDPNQQKAYMLLSISVAVLAAMALTYGLEQPVSKKLNQWYKRLEAKANRNA